MSGSWFFCVYQVRLKRAGVADPKVELPASIGLRLFVPLLGPLRLDYGVPLNSPAYADGGGQFHFGVGYSRSF
jgi:outer membrane protein assembly factor BamA